jgi:plasmid stability protein
MSKMIQLRNVPDALHRTLKVRAAQSGMSLSDFLIDEIERIAERPTLHEIRERLAARAATNPRVTPAQAVRMEREQR